MNNYTKTLVHRMARRTGTPLTQKHNDILEFASGYYERHHVGPLYQNLQRHTGVTKIELERLFPFGLQSVYSWIRSTIPEPK